MPVDVTKTEPITLRPATINDAPGLALVGAATFLEAFTWMLPGVDIIAHCAKVHTPESYRHYLAKPDTRITLATAGSFPHSLAPVGYTMLTTPELPTFDVLPSDIELKRIYLFSRFRSVPVTNSPLKPAAAMLAQAVQDARSLHRTRLLLGTHANNTRAIHFYLRNGFTQAGTRTFQVGDQLCDDYIFAKPL
jgi:ribosomal protein S18 acetylase RimI-like enzyme